MITEMATQGMRHADVVNRHIPANGSRLLEFQTACTSGILGIAGPGPSGWKQLMSGAQGNRCFTVFFVHGNTPLPMVTTGIPVAYSGHIFVDKPRYKLLPGPELNQPFVYAYFDCTEKFRDMLQKHYGIDPQAPQQGTGFSSVQLTGTPELEYVYYYLGRLQALQASEKHIELLVGDLVRILIEALEGNISSKPLDSRMIRNHSGTIDRAKEYIFEHFMEDISLATLARHCYASPFHFSRIFKQFSACAPHQYIQALRLKHAEILLRTTDMPIADISAQSGFRRTDYFSAAFKKRYKIAPSGYKRLPSE